MHSYGNQTVVLTRQQDFVDQAAIELDKFVTADNNYDDLSKRLRVYSEKAPNESGLNDHDYPSLTDDRLSLQSLPEISVIKRVPLPGELVEQFDRMQCNCMMGLFPEINRAWLTIDSDLFVWNYENGADLAYFDSVKETIIACGLVKPKPGTCVGIPYLLVITTPIEILLLGVTFGDVAGSGTTGDPALSDMNVLPTPLYTVASDNIPFLTIQGTSDGRIFLGASDGSLHEVLYQSQDGWVYKKCRKVNHSSGSMFSFLAPSFLRKEEEAIVQIEIDELLNVLYTRSDKGSIQVYDLDSDGKTVTKVAEMSSTSITKTAASILKTVDQSNFQNIVGISAVSKDESFDIQLVAVTEAGVRLYFAVKPFNNSVSRPCSLNLVHVRLPPGFSASTTSQRPSKIHMAHYNRGTMLMVSAQSDDLDLLWTISPDCFPFQTQLMETQITMPVGGRTWALTEEPSECVMWRRNPGESTISKCNPPLVVTQHMEQLRRFVLLTAQGSYIMNKLRPVDQLRALLLRNQGYDNHEVEAFFKLQKPDQACATCLILICSGPAVDAQVKDWAIGAFFLFGGDPTYNFTRSGAATLGPNYSIIGQDVTFNAGMSFHPSQVSTPNPNRFGSGGVGADAAFLPPSASAGQIVLSSKHDGIYLYLARILGPLWDSKLVGEVTLKGQKEPKLRSRIDEELPWFIDQLSSLMAFLHASSQHLIQVTVEGMMPAMRSSVVNSQIDEATKRKCIAEAINKEKMSLQQAMTLITRCLEVLNLWQLACDHQFEVVSKSLSDTQKSALKSNTLKTLLVSGSEDIFSALINGIIQQYLGDNACTDVISAKLREQCPSLYSLDDAKFSKANELLQSLKSVTNAAERKIRLEDAMSLYKTVSPHIDLPKACEMLASVNHYEGILDISLTSAAKRDPQNIALHYYKNGEISEDTTGQQLYTIRRDCYQCVLETLKFLLNASYTSAPAESGSLAASEAEQHLESLYSLCIKAHDELFHVALYEWMVNNDLTDRLLQISSPFLEDYLKRHSQSSSPDTQLRSLEVLCRYYEKNRQYNAAAHILSTLADRPSSDIDLQQRIEYLSRAVISVKSASFRSEKTDADFVHELEERLDVARVQLMVLDSLKKINAGRSEQLQEAMCRLNTELMDITTLYSAYADPFDLSECKLAILHCAGHYDSVLIEMLWQSIIIKEFEATQGSSKETRMQIIKNKIVQLAKYFGTNDKFFPLLFIVKDLEILSIQNEFFSNWVYTTMLDALINPGQLLYTYDNLLKAKDPCWRNYDRPYHLFFVIADLYETIMLGVSNMTPLERSRFMTMAQEISRYLVDLQSDTRSNHQTDAVARKFKEVQARLQRLTR